MTSAITETANAAAPKEHACHTGLGALLVQGLPEEDGTHPDQR
jgi:hypothetical protein